MAGDREQSRTHAARLTTGLRGLQRLNYYQMHLGDYARDTGHLSATEHGVYLLLMNHYYATEAPIPDAIVHRAARVRTAADRAAVNSVLGQFFKRDGGAWRHTKCDKVLAAAHAKSAKASKSATSRWECERNANAMRTHSEGNASHKPIANSQEKELSFTPPTEKPKARSTQDWEAIEAAVLRGSPLNGISAKARDVLEAIGGLATLKRLPAPELRDKRESFFRNWRSM